MLDIDMDKVRAMRSEGMTYIDIAGVFGCSYGTIQRRLNPARAAGQRARYERTGKARYAANPEPGRQAAKRWAAANPERVLAARRARYAANPEPIQERNRKHYAANAESINARLRIQYAASPEVVRERARKYWAEHPEIVKEGRRRAVQKRREDIQYRFMGTWRSARRRAERKGLTYEDVNLEALCERDDWSCQICGGPVDREIMELHYPWGMSFDHVIPESKGGGWTWANLQLAHRGCNAMRSNRSLEEARAFARDFLRRLAA